MPANQLVRNVAKFHTDLQACYPQQTIFLIKLLTGNFSPYLRVLTRGRV
jgi:hypothetical protein